MIGVSDPVRYAEALTQLRSYAVSTRAPAGHDYNGHVVQIFLALKFWQTAIPSMFSGQGISAGPLQQLLDDLFAKVSRPANECVVMVFEGRHLARTGLVGPGNRTAQNTWRNNMHLQKGIVCYADATELASPAFLDEPRLLCRHLLPAVAGELRGATCALAIGVPQPRYRREDLRKWLKISPDGNSFANVDTMLTSNFAPWVAPAGLRLPVVPLIVALYHDAEPSLATGGRAATGVDIGDFATDFNFSPTEFDAYFDQDPTSPGNASLIAAGGFTYNQYTAASVAPPVPPTLLPPTGGRRGGRAPAPLPTPVLTGTPVAPPVASPWWDAEQLVKRALEAEGWVVFHVSRQQLGYDLLAQRGTRTVHVEVKSSVGACSPVLTAREWHQAGFLGERYCLAIVENYNPLAVNTIHWVLDPSARCRTSDRTTTVHAIPRSSWILSTVPRV